MKPINRGETAYGPTATIDTSDLHYEEARGMKVKFKDYDFDNSPETLRSHGTLKARLMQNLSGVTLYGGRAVTHASGYRNERFDGYTRTIAVEAAGVIDPQLATIGVRNGDICLVFYDGPIEVYTGIALADDYSIGDLLYAVTADNSTGHTGAGKLAAWPQALEFTATETTDGTMGKVLTNKIGIAMSAATSGGETNTLKLVDLKIP